MADAIITPPVTQAPVAEQQQAPVISIPEPDLITKVTSFKKAAQVSVQTTSADGIVLDQKMIDSITDPKIKEATINLQKSLQADYTRKTQAVSDSRKQVEQQLTDMQTWTPEKVQKYLLNNPTFLQSAQQVAGNQNQNPNNSGLTDEQFSALTDGEKAQLTSLRSEINSLKQVNMQAVTSQTDAQLRTKYSDYDPQVVDNSLRELMNMQPHELREYVYKAKMHDEHVANAYALRNEELNKLNQTRTNAISVDGNTITNNDGMPVRQPNQNDRSWFETIANFRLAQSRSK